MSDGAGLEFAGSDEELAKYLAEAARAFGGWAAKDPRSGGYQLVFGNLLSLNPNTVRWRARVRREGTRVRLQSDALAWPWTRAKIGRIVAFRQTQIVDFLEVKLRGGNAERIQEQPFATMGSGPAEVTASFAWLIAASIACGLMAWFATILAALMLTDLELREISQRAELLKRLGAVAIPTPREIASIDFGFRLGIAALFAFPMAFFSGSVMALGHATAEVWARASRLPALLFAFLAVLHGLAFAPVLPLYVALPCAVLVPLAAHAGCSLVWGRKRERRRELAPAPRAKRVAAVGAILGVLLLLAIIPRPRNSQLVPAGLAEFRDRSLLGHPTGYFLSSVYYRYTLYAAEPLKDFYGGREDYVRTLRTARMVDRDPGLESHLRSLDFAVGFEPGGDYDLVVSRGGSGGFELQPGGIPVKASASLAEVQSAVAESSRRSFRAGALREVARVGWVTVFYLGPFVLLSLAALVFCPLFSILFRKLPRKAALAAIALLFTLSTGAIMISLSGTGGTLETLRVVREADSTEKLAPHLSHPEASVRYEAVRRLYEIVKTDRNAAAFDPLVAATRDADLRVRLWACGALGNLGDARAVPALIARLDDPELFVRYRAAEALGHLRDPAAVEPLLGLIERDSWYAGMYALHALRRIDPARF